MFKSITVAAVIFSFAAMSTATQAALSEEQNSSEVAEDGEQENLLKLYAERWETSRMQLGDKHPDTLVKMGDYAQALSSAKRLQEAETLYAELISFRREMPREESNSRLANNLYGHAYVLDLLNRTNEAQPILAEAWTEYRRTLGETHINTLGALGNNANLLLALGRTRDAEVARAEHLRLTRQIYGENSAGTTQSMGNHATILNRLGRWNEAELAYDKAWRIADAVLGSDHPVTLKNLSNYAQFLSKAGRPLQAEKYMSTVLERNRQKWGEKHQAKISSLRSYAGIIYKLGRPEEAEALASEAVELARELLGDSHKLTLASLDNHALFLNSLGRADEAEAILSEVLEARHRIQGERHLETIGTMSAYARTLSSLGQNDEAGMLHVNALRLGREILGRQHLVTIRILNDYALILGKTGRREEAEPLHAEALLLGKDVFGATHPETMILEFNLSDTRMRLPNRSHLAIHSARSTVSSLRNFRETSSFNPDHEAQLDRNEGDETLYLSMLADAAWAAGPGAIAEALSVGAARPASNFDEEAFGALQDIFGGAANKAVALAAARKLAENKDEELGELAVQRELLSSQWTSADEALLAALADNTPSGNIKRANLRDAKATILTEIQRIDNRLRRDAPDYFNFIRPQPLDLTKAKTLVGKEDAALMVVPSEFGTHVMAVSDKGLTWHRSDWTAQEINRAVRRLLWDVGANVEVGPADVAEWGDEGEGAYPFDRDTAHALYNQIIAPVAKSLVGKRHLYVAASGSLSSMPFGILVSRPPEGSDGDPEALRQTAWFADDHALVKVPSLQSLQFLRHSKKQDVDRKHDNQFQGFGDPLLDGQIIERAQRSIKQQSRASSAIINTDDLRNLARLPGTAHEVIALGKAFGASPRSIFLGERATEKNIRTVDLSGTRILALATHGLVAGEIRGANEPGLVFTPPEATNDSYDGLLTASEITELRLDADWVILSACNTATGDGSEGAPGLSGLARSFFYAGARNLLASHWPVRDEVAPKISLRTVEIRRDNPKLSRAEAFQRAIREIRNDNSADSETDTWAHPNAWAPFSLIGDR